MDTCRIFFVKATMKNNCVKIHRSTQNKISKLYLIDRFARKIGDNFGFFLFLMIKRENIISKRCERSSVISACPFVPDTRHAYISFLFTSRALIVQLVAHLYTTLQLFQVWSLARKRGGEKKKKKIWEVGTLGRGEHTVAQLQDFYVAPGKLPW